MSTPGGAADDDGARVRRQRVVIYSAGAVDKLQVEYDDVRISDLACADDNSDTRVAVAVTATGVNFADACVRQGLYASAREFVGNNGFPITPGFEVVGYVLAAGGGCRGVWRRGVRVLGVTLFNAYTSVLALDERYLFNVSHLSSLADAHLAALPAHFITAAYALRLADIDWLGERHNNNDDDDDDDDVAAAATTLPPPPPPPPKRV
eukprot:CAMPEP_0198317012 /NCGR_PEP_ID=MMETSP1450-20131203/6658_1 /TAXON_ID=753684 ORGANISM="Madagascaria erythrocladiodes, Strain CCMP3234" /NCGR_SAMPLE_ID=MMETSP1450 /ASSEMBLY_ACC=CAM_ASM_001115 /LENGTH=206 /DNA_ID=CAMNT_0044020193 /DNA_START=145 /DNA_END=762 /DNA_ORIENTATION=+